MRDPELVQRAERAATALEQALLHWRQRHGLDSEPLQPVTSYVGYSVTEPWGQPRVILGVHAEEAERLTEILEGHDCFGPVHAGVSGWPARRPEPVWTSADGFPRPLVSSAAGQPGADEPGLMAATVPAIPFMSPPGEATVSELEPLPPAENGGVDPAELAGSTAADFAGPAATWSQLAERAPATNHRPVGQRPADEPAADEPGVQPGARETADAAMADDQPAAHVAKPPAAPRRRVVAPRPRVSPEDSPAATKQPDPASPPKRQTPPATKRTKPSEAAKDRPAKTRLQPVSKPSRARRTTTPRATTPRTATQRPAAGTWPAVDGQPSGTDKSG